VLEPVNASPVVIEDEVVVGGNCGVYEGDVVRRRAVLAAGRGAHARHARSTTSSARRSTARARRPLEIPGGRRRRARSAQVRGAWGEEQGLALQTPVVVKYRDARTDLATASRVAAMSAAGSRARARAGRRHRARAGRQVDQPSGAHLRRAGRRPSRITGILDSADVRSTAGVLRALGVAVPPLGADLVVVGRGPARCGADRGSRLRQQRHSRRACSRDRRRASAACALCRGCVVEPAADATRRFDRSRRWARGVSWDGESGGCR
jgi:hypothetical protein